MLLLPEVWCKHYNMSSSPVQTFIWAKEEPLSPMQPPTELLLLQLLLLVQKDISSSLPLGHLDSTDSHKPIRSWSPGNYSLGLHFPRSLVTAESYQDETATTACNVITSQRRVVVVLSAARAVLSQGWWWENAPFNGSVNRWRAQFPPHLPPLLGTARAVARGKHILHQLSEPVRHGFSSPPLGHLAQMVTGRNGPVMVQGHHYANSAPKYASGWPGCCYWRCHILGGARGEEEKQVGEGVRRKTENSVPLLVARVAHCSEVPTDRRWGTHSLVKASDPAALLIMLSGLWHGFILPARTFICFLMKREIHLPAQVKPSVCVRACK